MMICGVGGAIVEVLYDTGKHSAGAWSESENDMKSCDEMVDTLDEYMSSRERTVRQSQSS